MLLTQLETEALALPQEERERLAGNLIRSLENVALSKIDEALIEVAERRYAAHKAGERQGIPHDRTFSDIRAELGWPSHALG